MDTIPDWLSIGSWPADASKQQTLYQHLRRVIADGHLPPGTRLPASRALATALSVARNTVLYAYEQLIAEGYLTASRHGTRVALLPFGNGPAAMEDHAALPGLSRRAQASLRSENPGRAAGLPFALGTPDVSRFPFHAWRNSIDRVWRGVTPQQLDYAPPGGEPALRQALADYLVSTRGLTITTEQVLITGGTQAALDLCARLLADSGEYAWMENPGYPAAQSALSLAGLRLHPVAVDVEGLAPNADDWQAARPRLIFVTPSHQYPTGHVMSLLRRLSLLEQARQVGAWVIEDDYDNEFRRTRPAHPAMYALRSGAPVVYLGTFSKTLYPGLRLAYLVVPREIADSFSRAAAQLTRPGQRIEQAALADFIARGHYTRHLRRMRVCYAARHERLRDELSRQLGPELSISGGDAGLHVTLWLPPEQPDRAIAEAAVKLGLSVQPLSRYASPPVCCNGLLLGYGNTDEQFIASAVRRLRDAIASVRT